MQPTLDCDRLFLALRAVRDATGAIQWGGWMPGSRFMVWRKGFDLLCAGLAGKGFYRVEVQAGASGNVETAVIRPAPPRMGDGALDAEADWSGIWSQPVAAEVRLDGAATEAEAARRILEAIPEGWPFRPDPSDPEHLWTVLEK